MTWKFQGRSVFVPPEADIPPEFWRGGRYGRLVQRVLDMLEPWEGRRRIFFTGRLEGESLGVQTARVRDEPLTWGVHMRHMAKQPGLSPFFRPKGTWPKSDLLTVTVIGRAKSPQVVSVYPGGYRPPLPWMASAKDCPAGEPEAFWNFNAFLLYHSSLIRPRSISKEPPDWYVRHDLD
jgi:hypothetical protein